MPRKLPRQLPAIIREWKLSSTCCEESV